MLMLKVLIAEDDLMIADMIEASLTECGYQVSGIARTVAEGVALGLEERPDLAIIDIRLADGGIGTEIVAQLQNGPRIGVLYASGNIGQITTLSRGDACIAKPYHTKDLVRALKIVERMVSNGVVSPPFPPGFRLLNANQPASRQVDHG
jgi:DNA-binding response OmpR family regulator